MRRRDDGNGSGHAEGEDRTSEEETHKVEGGAAKPGRQRVAAADATMSVGVMAEAEPARMEDAGSEEVTATEVIVPPTTTDEAATGETATAEVSSGPAGQEELRKAIEEAMKEASAGAEILEPLEVAAQASSSAALRRA
jgi:hypothetical protein